MSSYQGPMSLVAKLSAEHAVKHSALCGYAPVTAAVRQAEDDEQFSFTALRSLFPFHFSQILYLSSLKSAFTEYCQICIRGAGRYSERKQWS